jgi:hypothetical protein
LAKPSPKELNKRRTHSPEFKARVAMEAISGRKTIQQIAADHAIELLMQRTSRCRSRVELYLRAYSGGWEAEISLARFLWRYCHVRPHSTLGSRTPHEVYTETEPCSSRPGLTMSGAGTVQ